MIRRCPYLFRAAADLGSLSGLRKNSEMRLATGLRFCIVPDADFYRSLREGFAASSSNGDFDVGKSQSKIKIWSLLERETDSSVTGI